MPVERIGFTLPHEHTAFSLWEVPNRWDYWQLSRDERRIAAELNAFRAAGGSCLVDLTLPGVGRDPEWLLRLAKVTGIHIVMGGGWYREPYYPPDALIDRRSVDDLADELEREFRDGVGNTSIPIGIIGEIGTNRPWISAQEERVHRAAARAARTTGLAVSTHSLFSDVGRRQLAIFEQENLDPARVVIGHADSFPSLEYYLDICRHGAYLQFDALGSRLTTLERAGEPELTRLLLALLERGYSKQILLSQDVSHDASLRAFGGNGYTYLQEAFLPNLRSLGVTDSIIDELTIDNPRRVLGIVEPDRQDATIH